MDILKILQSNQAATIIAVVICVNIGLTATQKILEVIKDKTATNADNKAYEVISKVTGLLAKAIDWVTANKEHK